MNPHPQTANVSGIFDRPRPFVLVTIDGRVLCRAYRGKERNAVDSAGLDRWWLYEGCLFDEGGLLYARQAYESGGTVRVVRVPSEDSLATRAWDGHVIEVHWGTSCGVELVLHDGWTVRCVGEIWDVAEADAETEEEPTEARKRELLLELDDASRASRGMPPRKYGRDAQPGEPIRLTDEQIAEWRKDGAP